MGSGEGHLALVVEDDADNAALLRELVESRGDRARVAATVEEGLKALAEEEPCYCLIDQQLPTNAHSRAFVGGGQRMMVAARRRNARRPEGDGGNRYLMPIVVVTGFSADPDFIQEMFALGATAFVAKPLMEETLARLLGKIREGLELGGRLDHANCAACRAPEKEPLVVAPTAPAVSGPRIVIDGLKEGPRAHVFVNGVRREVQDAVFLMLLRLVAAHVRAPGSWLDKDVLGIGENRAGSSRVREVFRGLVPAGFEVLMSDRSRGYRLNPAFVVERVAWEALCDHADPRVQRVAKERVGRG